MKRSSDQKAQNYNSLSKGLRSLASQKLQVEKSLNSILERVKNAESTYKQLDVDTRDLQNLRKDGNKITTLLEEKKGALKEIDFLINEQQKAVKDNECRLQEIMSKIDLYCRLDEFVDYGHFDVPEYLYDTGERFAAEIKVLRERQKKMIKDGSAFVPNGYVKLTGDKNVDKKIYNSQWKMIMRVFNIESDLLISKVSPSNFDRTLSQIEKIANNLEKIVIFLGCGISTNYVALKYEECLTQYQYTLKKKEEQDEQKLIRAQMREEAKAEKEYRSALAAAEKDELLYRTLLEKVRKEYSQSKAEERSVAQKRIAELELQLEEVATKVQRAKSLAEQTRQGHVYVISNIGSFGKDIYKIGMTRRLDPLDRVKELGDASVPFPFDVHAIIFTDNAPSMETELHRKFSHRRVNAVNLRKEFFQVNLFDIQSAVEEIGGKDVDFKVTIIADEFYQTKRLREKVEVKEECQ